MCNNVVCESEIEFTFHLPFEKGDAVNCQGLKAVDFIVDGDNCLYFIEVKNYEQSKAPKENRERDIKMLTDKDTTFPLEIGMKVKDSLLRRYAQAKPFCKKIIFLLVIKLSSLSPYERENLYKRVIGYIPTGLNGYLAFSNISFEMPRIEDLNGKYGFDVRVL